MVVPILTPNTTSRTAYFPSSRWFDLNTGAEVKNTQVQFYSTDCQAIKFWLDLVYLGSEFVPRSHRNIDHWTLWYWSICSWWDNNTLAGTCCHSSSKVGNCWTIASEVWAHLYFCSHENAFGLLVALDVSQYASGFLYFDDSIYEIYGKKFCPKW